MVNNANFPRNKKVMVTVDKVVYVPDLDAPKGKPYPFVYFISIRNTGMLPVQILARKWIVKESCGEVVVVEGDGVVGQTPTLKQGEEFSYNSYHVVGSEAVVEGSFFGRDSEGNAFVTEIPRFHLNPPVA